MQLHPSVPSDTFVTSRAKRLPRHAATSHSASTLQQRALQDVLANEAMARYARGERGAFALLHALLAPRLYRLCIRLIGHADAEELLQEVLLRLHRARATFETNGSVTNWSFRIARNACIDHTRGRKRCLEDLLAPEQLELHAASRACCPESASTAMDLHQWLDVALLSLSEPLRNAYVMVKLDGLTCSEASALLDISVAAVKQRVHRASEELKLAMRQGGW